LCAAIQMLVYLMKVRNTRYIGCEHTTGRKGESQKKS
jgi:hypothetical protein